MSLIHCYISPMLTQSGASLCRVLPCDALLPLAALVLLRSIASLRLWYYMLYRRNYMMQGKGITSEAKAAKAAKAA